MSREIGAQLGGGWVLVKPATDYTRATYPPWAYDETAPVTPEQWEYLRTRMRAIYAQREGVAAAFREAARKTFISSADVAAVELHTDHGGPYRRIEREDA